MAVGQIVGPTTGGAAGLAQAERMLGHTKRVLLIAAHPDDEDTELLTYLVRREGAVAGYLSLTRGEGGQNLIGPELGEALGLIRSEELLAARSLDGGRQFFTRAFDFGFSKTLEETFRFWPQDTVLKDVVRIIRRFRPQLIVATFSGTRRDGHGQHQAAGWAANEAFAVAGDPSRFPELARDEGLEPWQPVKLYRSARFDTTGTALVLEGGRLDPEIGQSYRQIAMRGRSLHRSQDMGVIQEIGPSAIRLALLVDRTGGGAPLFAGVDTAAPPPASPESRDLEPYRATVTAIRAGLVVDAIADQSRLAAGQSVRLRLSAWNAGTAPVPVRTTLEVPAGWRIREDCLDRGVIIGAGEVSHCSVTVDVPEGAETTSPYFLRNPRRGQLYSWAGPSATWGEPFDPALLTAAFAFENSGQRFVLRREVVQRFRDQAVGEVRRPLAVVPRVDVQVGPKTKLWPLGGVRQPIVVQLHHAGRDSTTGTVRLDLPPGWPPVDSFPFRLTRPGERRAFTFMVKAPDGLREGPFSFRASARDPAGRRYEGGVVTVMYPHIRERGYWTASTVTGQAAALRFPERRRIGYVRGAADLVPEALAGLGMAVELIDAAQLERGDLSRFDAIAIGSRAYETEPALVENNGRLLDFVRQGGHLLVQYQQQPFFGGNLAPFPLALGRQSARVTDETAPITVLAPNDPIFNAPNPISARDWEGWVQERGLYFPETWDSRFTPLLESHDPGEPPLRGGLLLARYGKGTYGYTGLAFFRQLTAGVPGAFRLFLNLLAVESRAALP
jgi:LmbE family N-acetylglucosaminyl deacetylase